MVFSIVCALHVEMVTLLEEKKKEAEREVEEEEVKGEAIAGRSLKQDDGLALCELIFLRLSIRSSSSRSCCFANFPKTSLILFANRCVLRSMIFFMSLYMSCSLYDLT
ncbi:hypothetical protein ANCCAN_05382 [Ancylostoma caninum]|uniref:Uncharacterized protein n=1 Tax=Ancylostoma caninum TaxID=29170 RepID=A0A368GZU9_ANCCA|nr:hypothetical protein ANCCAN_05382 [Ancylostoma caninum]